MMGGLLPVSFLAITFVLKASALSLVTSALLHELSREKKEPIITRHDILSLRINQQQGADHYSGVSTER